MNSVRKLKQTLTKRSEISVPVITAPTKKTFYKEIKAFFLMSSTKRGNKPGISIWIEAIIKKVRKKN